MTPSDASGYRPPDLPELRDTIVVAAFEGWNDAGDAASDALEHLDAIWEAETIVEIDDEAYYDYQVNRPVIRQVDGVTRELVWPSMRISHCRPPGSDRDIVLMHGVEPNMRWRTFCAELLAIADKLNVQNGRHPGCAAGRHAAHPPGAGVGGGLLPRIGEGVRAGGDAI